MKKVINILLGLCIIGLAYILYGSIMGPINFDKEKTIRDEAVKNRLIDIRTAQVEYNAQHGGQYTASMDTLIDFVKNGKVPTIAKIGELTDRQMEDLWTESKVLRLYQEARTAKNKRIADEKWQEAIDAGFVTKNADGSMNFLFSRDTVWNDIIGTVFPADFNADSMRYVPFGNGAEFEMAVGCDSSNKSGTKIYLFEAKTPYTVYLDGINKTELANIIDDQTKLGRYPGLKVGDAEVGNNNAGNWE